MLLASFKISVNCLSSFIPANFLVLLRHILSSIPSVVSVQTEKTDNGVYVSPNVNLTKKHILYLLVGALSTNNPEMKQMLKDLYDLGDIDVDIDEKRVFYII